MKKAAAKILALIAAFTLTLGLAATALADTHFHVHIAGDYNSVTSVEINYKGSWLSLTRSGNSEVWATGDNRVYVSGDISYVKINGEITPHTLGVEGNGGTINI